jgi:hypothetical protein
MVDEIFEHRDLVKGHELDKVFLTSSLFRQATDLHPRSDPHAVAFSRR